MKRLKSLAVSLLVLVVLLLTCHSLLPLNSTTYGSITNQKLLAGDGIINPPPKQPYVITPGESSI